MRIPGWYERRHDHDREVDVLTCVDGCGLKSEWDAGDLVPRELIECPGCGLESRVPALPSEAGAPDADPPTQDERM